MGPQISCPSCHALFQTTTDNSFMVVCPQCRALFERGSRAVLRAQDLSASKPLLPIGTHGTLNGMPFSIVGWIRYEGDDEGVSFSWYEWQLQGPGAYWLEEDSDTGDFKLYQRAALPAPIPLDSLRVGGELAVEGKPFTIREIDTAQAVEFAGELDWAPIHGEGLHYVDASSGSEVCSLEDAGEDQEAYVGIRLSASTVAKAFGVKATARSPARRSFLAVVGVILTFIAVQAVGAYAEHRRLQRAREDCAAAADPAQCLQAAETALRSTTSNTHRFRSGSTSFGK